MQEVNYVCLLLQEANLCMHACFTSCSRQMFACMFHFLQQVNLCMHACFTFCSRQMFAGMFHFLQQANLCTHACFTSCSRQICKCMHACFASCSRQICARWANLEKFVHFSRYTNLQVLVFCFTLYCLWEKRGTAECSWSIIKGAQLGTT